MSLEIERKFLVIKDRLPELKNGQHFVQGYLSDEPQLRFRIIDNKKVIVCLKKILDIGQRIELEFPRSDLNEEDRLHMVSMAIAEPVVKIRYCVDYAELTWEIDVYQEENEGLITAEVELNHMDQEIDFPPWIDSDRELTGESRYANINLSRHPYKRW